MKVLIEAKDGLQRLGALLVGVLICLWTVLIFVLLEPPYGDYGVYISVAERLIAGDVLYDSVWNNKDPLYYLTLATARILGPLGGWISELGWLVVLSIGMQSISRSLGARFVPSIWVGYVFAPLVATKLGGPVPTGMALAIIAIALHLRGRSLSSGLLLAVLFFFKITLFPVALVMVIAINFTGSKRNLARVAVGIVGGAGSIVLLLVIRKEFFPYLESLLLNVEYSRSITSGGLMSSAIQRIQSTIDLSSRVTILTVILIILMAFFQTSTRPLPRISAILGPIFLGLLAVVIVLGLTGQWTHHATILTLPALVSIPVFVILMTDSMNKVSPPALGAIAVVSALLAGVPNPSYTLEKLEYTRSIVSALKAEPVEAALIKRTGAPTTYARVGQGDDNGHALGLGDWTLACPRFMQFWWEPKPVLDRSLNCLSSSDVILVAPSGSADPQWPDAWNDYIAAVESLLIEEYECESDSNFRICQRL